MKQYQSRQLGQDALEFALFALLLVAVLPQVAEAGSAGYMSLLALVFLFPAVASAAVRLYRDVRDDLLHH